MRKIVPVVLLLASAACGASDYESQRAAAATVRDSAGVTIVESTGPSWTQGSELTVSAEPSVSIGEMDGPPEYQLYQVRAARRMLDGNVVVLDGGSQEVRYYDSTGKYIRRSGGKGGGPGEYQGASWMVRLPGDSLVIYDRQAQRITILAPDGTLARTVSLAVVRTPASPAVGSIMRYSVVGPMADGSLLATVDGPRSATRAGSAVMRDSTIYVKLTANGLLLDTLVTLIGDEEQSSLGGSEGHRVALLGPPPFGHVARVAIDVNGFWFGSSDSYQLEYRDADGKVDLLIRRPVDPIAVTQAVVDAAREQELSRTNNAPAEFRTMLRQMIEDRWSGASLARTMPAYGELFTSDDGLLWVNETNPPDDTIPRWTAFDAEGRMLGTVTMPANFRALEFGRDYVLGVATDENEVERVELFQLTAPEP